MGVLLARPAWACGCAHVQPYAARRRRTVVVLFHLAFNVAMSVAFIGLTQVVANAGEPSCCPSRQGRCRQRPHHLDPSALATPSLAISCAAREALHQADIVETMMLGMLP
jgi:phosphate:Na+ symporter